MLKIMTVVMMKTGVFTFLWVVGSLKIGETEKVARQHDATQTQEAAPLPPMQSAHIHRTSSSNGLITQADSGLARHERHQSECTQSLSKAYASTAVDDNLARHVNQCTKDKPSERN